MLSPHNILQNYYRNKKINGAWSFIYKKEALMAKKETTATYETNEQKIPSHIYDSFARCLLPLIKTYYESDEGKQAFEEWKESQNKKW